MRPSRPGTWAAAVQDQATFTSEALPRQTVMAGSGSVDLWIAAAAEDVDLQATLSEVRPDGQEMLVQSGWLRASHRAEDATSSTPLRPRHLHTAGSVKKLVPGTWTRLRIELFSHVGHDERRRDGLAATNRQGHVVIGLAPLVEGDEVLALVPLKAGIDRLLAVAEVADTCVAYKAGRHIAALRAHLQQNGEQAVAGVNIGLPEESVVGVDELIDAPYFTSVLWPPRRGRTGARL